MRNILINLIMWYMHKLYTDAGQRIYEIKGTGDDYPKYLVYVESEDLYKRLEQL